MDIKIYSNIEIDSRFKEYIEDKFSRLDKFVFDRCQAEIYIKKEGHLFLTEIKVMVKNSTIFIKKKADDLNKSIEILYDKTKRQLRKLHDKTTKKTYN